VKEGLLEAVRLLDVIAEAEISGREETRLPLTVPAGTASAARLGILRVAASLLRDRAERAGE
jgi:hypothetical protein